MGLSDKFKNLAKQAQDAVADHADKLHDAVDTVGVAVNEKTQGKYASKIAKVGEKTGSTIDKLSGTEAASPAEDTATEAATDTFAEAEHPASSEAATTEPAAAGVFDSSQASPTAPDVSQSAADASDTPEPATGAPTTPPAGGFPSFDE